MSDRRKNPKISEAARPRISRVVVSRQKLAACLSRYKDGNFVILKLESFLMFFGKICKPIIYRL